MVLKSKLAEKNIQYEENNSVEYMKSIGITEVPVLYTNETYMNFKDAVNWINSL